MTAMTLTTDKGLLSRLITSAQKGPTEEELRQQRISFIYAGMPKESTMTKQEIERVIEKRR